MRSLLALALLPLTLARSVELHHRLITSSNEASWIPLGSVEVDSSTFGHTALQPRTAKADKLDLSDDAIGEGAWYQVGVEGDDGWVYGSTRAVS
jgi:hypothetical protein